jgi:hypothetical protein
MGDAKLQEQYSKILLDLLQQPENKTCADCGAHGKILNSLTKPLKIVSFRS